MNTNSGSGFTLVWTNSNGDVVSNDPQYTTSIADTYTLTVVNNLTNCSSSGQVVVAGNTQLPTVEAGSDVTLDCNSTNMVADLGTANTNSGSGFTVEWTDASGNVVSNDPMFSTSNSGTYTLTVINTMTGCENFDVVEVINNSCLLYTSDAADE